ncbi:MAG: hypothetical protein B1H40_01070 [Candidatus Latescibacteria bacterium 4484_181]|nr:MAG: hypothetical protein B1H40_01070 [Candidatus Latescibacteria bacterium 4484_181]
MNTRERVWQAIRYSAILFRGVRKNRYREMLEKWEKSELSVCKFGAFFTLIRGRSFRSITVQITSWRIDARNQLPFDSKQFSSD